MPSNYTQNYNLNQWAADDQVVRADFNADNAKIDAALKAETDARTAGDAALQTAVNAKAAASALSALSQTVNTKADASALSALQTVVNGKAAQSALTALQTVVNGKGNCRIVTGQYTGTGMRGQTHPCTLAFDHRPLVLLVANGNVMISARGGSAFILNNGGSSSVSVVWGDKSVSWYTDAIDASAGWQMNASGAVYTYVVLLEL